VKTSNLAVLFLFCMNACNLKCELCQFTLALPQHVKQPLRGCRGVALCMLKVVPNNSTKILLLEGGWVGLGTSMD
jgi:hypothetical protein